jgi:hypothetical protein
VTTCLVFVAAMMAPAPALTRANLDAQIQAAILAANAKGRPAGYSEWLRQMKAAKARSKSGQKRATIGAGVMLGGALVGAAATSVSPDAGGVLLAASVLGGTVMFGHGIYNVYKATVDIGELDHQGRIKGYYLSLGPALGGGAQVAVTLRF